MRAHIYVQKLVGCGGHREGSGLSVGGGGALLHTHHAAQLLTALTASLPPPHSSVSTLQLHSYLTQCRRCMPPCRPALHTRDDGTHDQ
jgi:hypothetical protein